MIDSSGFPGTILYFLSPDPRPAATGGLNNPIFVGSNSSLVAPLTIEENSVIGAGSVITKNVKKNSLALTRSSQITKKNYKRKKK